METNSMAPSTFVLDTTEAVGVPEPLKWFIAIVKHGDEKKCAGILSSLGYEVFLPAQRELRRYSSGRKKWVDRLVITSKVFVRATEKARRTHLVNLPVVNRFMTDPARRPEPKANAPVAVIADREMEMFRRMLGQDELPVEIEDMHINYAAGDKVQVVIGKLAGLEGIVKQVTDGRQRLYISLDLLGSASVVIDRTWLAPINSQE